MDKKKQLTDEKMRRRALSRWENEGGSPLPEKAEEPKPAQRPVSA